MTIADASLDVGIEEIEDLGHRRSTLNHILILLLLLFVWESGSHWGLIDDLTLPPPSAIARSIFTIFITQGNIWWNLAVTLSEALAGFVVGSTVGIGLAVAAALSSRFRRYLKPYVVLVQVTPRVAIAPIIVAALGFGWSPKIVIAAMICFFAPFVNTLSGLLNVDEETEELFRSLGATKGQVFWKLLVPHALPIIMAGLKLAAASAFAGAIVGEYIAANQGVGVLIMRYTQTLNMASAFASLLTLSFTGFMLFKIMEAVDNHVVFWRSEKRLTTVGAARQRRWSASI